MKQILLFVVSMLSGVFLNAQTISYQPLHGDYSQYGYRFQSWNGSVNVETLHKTIWSGDTTIGGETYTRIFQDGIYSGGIREDVANQQRFFINRNDVEIDITIDYDLSVGTLLTDSSSYINAFRTYIEITYPGNYFALYDTLRVAQLDSVLESSGDYSVSYRLTRPQNTGESVLFNTYSGLLELNGFEYNYSQICYSEDGEQTLPGQETPWSIMCDLGIAEEHLLQISVSPNPSIDFVELSGKDLSLIQELTIYDLHGKIVKFIPQSELNTRISLDALESGVYLLALNGNSKMLRLIKQ